MANVGRGVPGNGQRLNARQQAQTLSRWQGPELLFNQVFTALGQPIIPNNLNLTRPCESLDLIWTGRVTIGGANYTSVAAEAPQTIINRIILQGTHKSFNQIIPINASGATVFCYTRLFQRQGNPLYINGMLQPDPSLPFAQSGTVFGNTGTYDLRIHYNIPFSPIFGPWSARVRNYFQLNPNDWVANSLQLQLFFGDATSFGVPAGGTTVAFSAFGSNSGSPQVGIYQNFGILGPMAQSIVSPVVIRNEQNVISGSLGAIATAQRLALLQKQQTTALMLKTGILQTTASPGVIVMASLSDTICNRSQVIVDNKPVKNNPDNFAAKDYMMRMFDTIIPQGYLVFPWTESQTPLTAFQAQTTAGGTTFEFDSDVIASASNQFGTIIQEQVLGQPGQK